jgi:hypothetical protein
MSDAMLVAEPVEDVGAEITARRPVPVLRQVSKGHAVVGQDGVDGVGEDGHDLAEKGGPVHPGVGVEEATWVNFDTWSMARNMKSLPSARRSSQTSMWT